VDFYGRTPEQIKKADLENKIKLMRAAGHSESEIQTAIKESGRSTASTVKGNVDEEVEKLVSENASNTPGLIINYSKDPEYGPLFKAEKAYPEQSRDIAIVIRDMELKNPEMKPAQIRKEIESLMNTCELK
jgi:predicted phosphodiesterase